MCIIVPCGKLYTHVQNNTYFMYTIVQKYTVKGAKNYSAIRLAMINRRIPYYQQCANTTI